MAKVNNRKKDFFWLSYSDLMTSLFFVMLVLFVLVYSMQNSVIQELKKVKKELEAQNSKWLETKKELEAQNSSWLETKKELERRNLDLNVAKRELDRIKEIEKSISNIDGQYFEYDFKNKKHILNVKFKYPRGRYEIRKIIPDKRRDLVKAGKAIKNLIQKFPEEENIKYLVIVEGQASKDNWEGNDKLSFRRAQSLIKLWKDNEIELDKLKNCEVIVAGSGEGGIPRIMPDKPPANQRFLITIIPKIGEISQ